ncbi:MAG: Cof-type HAD-IIB family hydrolase [Erysipelotrichaceae bacterium]|jgi:Cof subfamily protein (haloacid dehalogenase superfamily)|nr:Cof-type HAD-IIB family hydrolase [Erysipelotrichaceae bacterium]
MIKIAVFDIDGTVYDTRRQAVDPQVIAALSTLQKNHIVTAVATGRGNGRIQETFHHTLDYIISCNGRAIQDGNDAFILKECMPKKEVLDIIDFALAHDIKLICKSERICYTTQAFPLHGGMQEDALEIFVPSDDLKQYADQVFSFFMGFESEQTRKALSAAFPDLAFALARKAETLSFYDVYQGERDKSWALSWLLKKLNLSSDELLTMGDGTNDISMLDLAGVAIAMGNSPTEVKAHADYVSTDFMDQGMVNGLKWAGLLK